MKKASLKISAILLCGLLIYNSLGYFLVLSVMRMAVRQQKWAQLSSIPEQQLTIFNFDKNFSDLRLKIVNKREILVEGKLYDIVRKTEKGNIVTYFCVHDRREETLITKTRIFNSMAQQMPNQSIAKLIIEKIIKTAVITYKSNLIHSNYLILKSNFNFIKYSGPTLKILLPPPQSCC